jgi:hypothetical protein
VVLEVFPLCDPEEIASNDASCVRLQQMPGGATGVDRRGLAIGNGAAFQKGREFAAKYRIHQH